jgi:membrane protein implicated in regulation of membrane protease activity
MNDKQITQLAFARARTKLKWSFATPMFIIFFALQVAVFVTGDLALIFVGGAVLAIEYIWVALTASKIKSEIIQNKDSQIVTEKEIKKIAVNRATSSKWFLAWDVILAFIIVVPVIVNTIPMYYRCAMLIVGILGLVVLLRKSRQRSNALQKDIDSEFGR